jgi:hypothetical protein
VQSVNHSDEIRPANGRVPKHGKRTVKADPAASVRRIAAKDSRSPSESARWMHIRLPAVGTKECGGSGGAVGLQYGPPVTVVPIKLKQMAAHIAEDRAVLRARREHYLVTPTGIVPDDFSGKIAFQVELQPFVAGRQHHTYPFSKCC